MTTFLDQQLAMYGTLSLFFNTILYWFELFLMKFRNFSNFSTKKYKTLVSICSSLLIGCSLLLRWYKSGYFPLSNLYESLLFLSWCLINGYILIEKKSNSSLSGLLITPIAALLCGFATYTLPNEMQKAIPLVPALQSNWLMMHVSMMMLSYATLILGSTLSILYVLLWSFVSLSQKSLFSFSKLKFPSRNLLLNNLDLWSYRTIGLGFPLLTIGIIAGAVWANEAWGSYWSWDPKETWALITWLIFAAYLHARIIRGWKGHKAAFVASTGFIIIWICYLGVNFLGKGLHSYGWIS